MSTTLLNTADAQQLECKLRLAAEQGLVAWSGETDRNQYLWIAYRGVGEPLASSWNVKLYQPSRRSGGKYSLVCTDLVPLRLIWQGKFAELQPSAKPVVTIDDAGWGFPLCGVAVGVCLGDRVDVEEIPVAYFRLNPPGSYLEAYSHYGRMLLRHLDHVSPETHRIDICTGYVNTQLRDDLRAANWETRVVKVVGTLQDQLEQRFRGMVAKQVKRDIYFDPKAIPKAEIPTRYYAAVNYGIKHCPDLVKNGWESLRGF